MTKRLQEGEYILHGQKIHAPKKSVNKQEAQTVYVQKANRKLLGILPIPYLAYLYYTAEQRYDKEECIRQREKVEKKFNAKIAAVPEDKIRKINNLQFKKRKKIEKINDKIENGNTVMQWGEPYSILDTANIELTKERLHDYLASNGYFQNTVTYKISTIGDSKNVNVDYYLNPGKAYSLDSIYYDIHDSTILKIVNANTSRSYLRVGDNYKQDNFTKERERIDLLLKDHGYYEFSRQYIEFEVDTVSRSNRRVVVKLMISDPAQRGYHKQFVLTGVNFVTDAGSSYPGITRQKRRYRDIDYQFYKDDYNLRILSQRVFISPGSLYNRTNTFNTQRQISNLDAFRFVNINYDSSGGKFIANIFTSPLDRYQISNEAGVSVTQGFPGPFYNLTFKKRNVFGGLEMLDFSGRYGFEGVASATKDQNIYKSTEAGINVTMTFPQLIFPMREKSKVALGKLNPKTKLLAGYSLTDRPEYRRTYLTLSGTYSVENRFRTDRKSATEYSFSFANFSIIDTVNTSPDFRDFLQDQNSAGNFSLVNSFYPSFVTSMIFGVTWNFNDYASYEKNSIIIRALLESGGTMWNFVDPDIITRNGLQYYKYLRFSLDIRRHRVLDKNTVIAYRFNSGVAYSYGENKGIPYEKFFFAGGSNSVRAWRPRRLGPGSFRPDLSEDPRSNGLFNYSIEKPGEILLEASIELRKNLFGFVDGAIFVDAGNVWSFNNRVKIQNNQEIENGNSKFQWNSFYKEIGIGTGFGLRFDFTFLILRFDVGMKVYDPARDPGDRFVLNKVKFWSPYGTEKEPVIYNVGIGYPF